MIMLWNQKEVFVGYSLQKFNEIRQILSANKIKYKYRLVNNSNDYLFSSRGARTGTFGENMNYSITYYVYVHKKDYENACAILKNPKYQR
ncbi:hypothetical protein [Candidatus Clostridium radicumherbarum]|uniref:DUF2007 domain-containing protein n=1 Tax=Candidatus Clostridium radicumherbarum TaxID=3381662 RepID=A0ABW8TQR5_9CLOT